MQDIEDRISSILPGLIALKAIDQELRETPATENLPMTEEEAE